jgi:hypothetical protein
MSSDKDQLYQLGSTEYIPPEDGNKNPVTETPCFK